MKQETFEIKTEIYEEMVFQYFSALDRIMDLELENYELQEELKELKERQ
ncbi:MAG TPA: hypothetical protein H9780_12195 [Candidatus Mediterraneibacter merdavium]|nr:hypothetical protein [Candidatus Mediterraneibacter merdavium]